MQSVSLEATPTYGWKFSQAKSGSMKLNNSIEKNVVINPPATDIPNVTVKVSLKEIKPPTNFL
ncbi:hypothetical protein N9Y26_01020 [bacterium]|nr:hypothetical protein [bacterium]